MDTLTGKCIKKDHRKKSNLASQLILCRMQGGKLYENLARDIKNKDYHDRFFIDFFKYIAGERFAFFLFPKKSTEIEGEYTAGGILYHITPEQNIDRIKKSGITSRRKYVFLSDSVEYISNEDFLNWKATKLKKNTDFRIIKIDSAALCKKHRLMLTDRAHEIVTEKVEPEFTNLNGADNFFEEPKSTP